MDLGWRAAKNYSENIIPGVFLETSYIQAVEKTGISADRTALGIT